MQEDPDIRHELTAMVRDLPAEQIKVAILKWLGEKGNLADLEQELVLKQKSHSQAFNDPKKRHTELSSSQKAKAFREWAESHRRNIPPLSDEAISRESIYHDERL